ncbi:hypothetical protein HYZ82_02180, partial [Candidatus Nomurabacteria bacterium]|nr:hypothetical protein [Candidatus Nomurabacteria bacterium]
MKPETKNCQNCKNSFIIEPDDFGFYEKMKVPPPTFCPDCRFQRRLLFRNNRVFYKRECGLCKKPVITIYHKDRPFIIYCHDCWLSDKWNPMDYGRDYNFSVPFFFQWHLLQKAVPRVNLYQENFIQSDYCNYGMDFKECYLLFGGKDNERVYFGNQVFESHDSLDIAFCSKTEFSYEIFECSRLNKVFFSYHSRYCMDSCYLINCHNCTNCFGCVELVNKKYCIFNKQYSKEEYEKFIEENTGSYKRHCDNLKRLKELRLSIPHRYARITQCVDSTGDDIRDSRNIKQCFTCGQAENSKFLFFCRRNVNECYDNSFQGFDSELLYEIAHGFGGSRSAFGVRNIFNQDSQYNEECHNCTNIFGCEGLRKKQYCILNRQYSKEEYEKLLPKIIVHMKKTGEYGEFFPSELSPFAYNETIAQEYFPLTKKEVLQRGYSWQDGEERHYKIEIKNENIPDNIKDIEDDIVGKVIECGHKGQCKHQCTEAFKIVPEELKFYKRMNLPLPRLCPNCRHYERINQRNPLKLWNRACMCDKKDHF